jgi:hypothetical protein
MYIDYYLSKICGIHLFLKSEEKIFEILLKRLGTGIELWSRPNNA